MSRLLFACATQLARQPRPLIEAQRGLAKLALNSARACVTAITVSRFSLK